MIDMFNRKMRPDESGINGLSDLCAHVLKTNKVKRALEVGSYKGESTVVFANKFNDIEELIAVDPFSLNNNSDNLFTENNINHVENCFLENIKQYSSIKHLKKTSMEAASMFDDNYFDFIYIDGCHQIESVILDAKSWLPKVKNGGHISFHDIDNNQVKSALSMFFDLTSGFISKDNSITFEVQK